MPSYPEPTLGKPRHPIEGCHPDLTLECAAVAGTVARNSGPSRKMPSIRSTPGGRRVLARSRKAIKYDLAGFSPGRLEVTLASSPDGNSHIELQLERNRKRDAYNYQAIPSRTYEPWRRSLTANCIL